MLRMIRVLCALALSLAVVNPLLAAKEPVTNPDTLLALLSDTRVLKELNVLVARHGLVLKRVSVTTEAGQKSTYCFVAGPRVPPPPPIRVGGLFYVFATGAGAQLEIQSVTPASFIH
jgi:hypothetical protein